MESLTEQELQSASQARGMRAIGVPAARLRSQLKQVNFKRLWGTCYVSLPYNKLEDTLKLIGSCLWSIKRQIWMAMDDLSINNMTDSMLPCIWSVLDHRGHKKVVRTPVTHLVGPVVSHFLFLPLFDIIRDLLTCTCTCITESCSHCQSFINYSILM